MLRDLDRLDSILSTGSTAQLQRLAAHQSGLAPSTAPSARPLSPDPTSPRPRRRWSARDTHRLEWTLRQAPSILRQVQSSTPQFEDVERVAEAAGCSLELAERALSYSQGDTGHAILLAISGQGFEEAAEFSESSVADQLLLGRREVDVDQMSYEQLLQLGDAIGHVKCGVEDPGEVLEVTRLSSLDLKALVAPSDCSHHDARCAVCLSEYQKGEQLAVTACMHRFHLECLSKWLEGSKKCPLCLSEVDSKL